MSQGLLVKDANGRVVLDPDTFTVRLVDRFTVGGAGIYSRPRVATGMFCVFQSQAGDAEWTPPIGVVAAGAVTVRASLPWATFTAGVECLVLAHV